MEFSEENIVSKHFSKKIFGGLDEFEVRDFLHALAEEIQGLKKNCVLQKNQLQEQETLIQDFRDREHILKESIANAEKWAEKVRKDAEENSCLILEKAHSKSESLIQEARHSLQTVYNDITDLKRLQLQLRTGLKAALQVQMDLLDQEPLFGPGACLSESPLKDLLGDQVQKTNKKEKLKPSLLKKEETLNPQKQEEENLQTQDIEEDSLNETSKNLSIDDKELHSLKESLSALNRTFS